MNTGPNTVKDLQELASKHVEMAKHEWVPDDAKRLCYKTARALESAARTIDEWHNETQMQVTIPLTGTKRCAARKRSTGGSISRFPMKPIRRRRLIRR
jgi:hypothetical protein